MILIWPVAYFAIEITGIDSVAFSDNMRIIYIEFWNRNSEKQYVSEKNEKVFFGKM